MIASRTGLLGLSARPLRCPRWGLALLLCALGVYRLSLIDTGHFYWGDEDRYLSASGLLDALERGDAPQAAEHLFTARRSVAPARPGFIVISLLPALLQRACGAMGLIELESYASFHLASLFNVLVTLGITITVYSLGRVWTGSSWCGLLIAFLHSILAISNIWIRHLVPYPESLLFILIGLRLVSVHSQRPITQIVRLVGAGVLTGFGYSCYPGHYALVGVVGVVVLFTARPLLHSWVAFGAGGALVAGGYELLARFAGRSYFEDLSYLSRVITMGDASEGYVFAWRYLRDVEGVVGVALLVLCMVLLLMQCSPGRGRLTPVVRVTFLAVCAAYLFHASMGVLFGRMVFYGRLLMVYMPFVVGAAVLAIVRLEHLRLRSAGIVCLVALSLASFARFAHTYASVEYPHEFLQRAMAMAGRDVIYPPYVLWGRYGEGRHESVEAFDEQLVTVSDTLPGGTDLYVRLASHRGALESARRFIGVNLKYMGYVRERFDSFRASEEYELVAEVLHPETLAATQYEGRKPWERQRLSRRAYTMRLYQRRESLSRIAQARETP